MLRLVLAALFALALPAAAAEKIRVSSFSTILTELAQQIGGERVAVTAHVKPGVDPHDFQPKPSDMKTVASAQLVLLSAKHMEGYVGKLREAAGGGARVVEVGDQFPSLKLTVDHGDHSHDGEDPHWWHSVANVQRAAKVIRDELTKLSPADKAAFAAATARADARLGALLRWAKAKVAELPRDRRKLVTSHDAFNYLARELGFKVYAVEGFSTADQPSSKKVADLIATIRAQGVKAVFSEDTASPKVLAEITRETGAKLGGQLYADGLGKDNAATFEGMYRHNVTTIVEALK